MSIAYTYCMYVRTYVCVCTHVHTYVRTYVHFCPHINTVMFTLVGSATLCALQLDMYSQSGRQATKRMVDFAYYLCRFPLHLHCISQW